MIYNDKLPAQYGTFTEISSISDISKSKPFPTEVDFENGYIQRYFLKKINENIIFETSYLSAMNSKNNLYKLVNLRWKISGPKNNVYKANILDKAGVTEQNRSEIERVKKETGVDLSGTLTNLLEYWRGR